MAEHLNLNESETEEYEELVAVLSDYQRFLNLYHIYFCKASQSGSSEWVFIPESEERNQTFYAGWPERKEKILARIKANKYFVRNGRIGDKKELRTKDAKYQDLAVFYELKKKFEALETVLVQTKSSTLSAHISMLRKRRAELEQKTLIQTLSEKEVDAEKLVADAKTEMQTLNQEKQKTEQ